MSRDIAAELATVRVGEADPINDLLPAMRAYAGVPNLTVYTQRAPELGGGLERWQESGFPDGFVRRAKAFFSSDAAPTFYDVQKPAPHHRNRLIEATSWIDRDVPGTFRHSAIMKVLLAPTGFADALHHRALLCDGSTLLAWFGVLQPEPLADEQATKLRALFDPLRARLALERRLARGATAMLALEAVLEALGAPAFVLGGAGEIRELNSAARALIATRRASVAGELRDAIRGAPSPFQVAPLRENGASNGWLATLRAPSPEDRVAAKVDAFSQRLRLTPRQRKVLALVAVGQPNANIAATLGIGARAVELHVTAILERAQVENRAQLVARVLAG